MVEDLISNTSMNLAVAYIRVSTLEQKNKGLSTKHQREMAKKYVEEYNKKIEASNISEKEKNLQRISLEEKMIFKEAKPASTVFSNSIDNDLKENIKSRPVLQEIIDLAQQKKFGHLIVLSRDRLSRDFEQFVVLKYLLNKNGIKIHYTRPGENLEIEDKKINRFIDNVLASVAELEANIISVRVKSGSRICIKNGRWAGGRAPFGYINERFKIAGRSKPISYLKTSYFERSQVVEVFQLYSLGYGYRKIAEKMNTIHETNIWTKSKVESIIKNETYTGYITWDRRGGRRRPGKHEKPEQSSFNEALSFINKEQWNSLVKLREYKQEIHDPKYYDTPYLLKKKLTCAICGKTLEPRNYGKDKYGSSICIYRCPTKVNKKYELILKKEYIENLVITELKKILLSCLNTPITITQLWNTYCEKIEKQNNIIYKEIDDLSEKIKNVEKLRTNIQFMVEDVNSILLKEKLLYQDTILSKLRINYEREKNIKSSKFEINVIKTISDYQNALQHFLVDLDKLDSRSKRIFIDLLVDEIIVSNSDNTPSLKIIVNPSPKFC